MGRWASFDQRHRDLARTLRLRGEGAGGPFEIGLFVMGHTP